MSEKRRDNRNRVLRSGESQRTDGRYQFKYQDNDGKVKFVYSWRLDKNDRTPAGKKRELSLREKEKQIEHDLFDRIVPNGGNMTVLELVKKYGAIYPAAMKSAIKKCMSMPSESISTTGTAIWKDSSVPLRMILLACFPTCPRCLLEQVAHSRVREVWRRLPQESTAVPLTWQTH